MLFLAIFSALAVGMAEMASANIQVASNHRGTNQAFAGAQSGLDVIRHWLNTVNISATVAPANRLAAVATSLQNNLVAANITNISANYDAAAGTITIPDVVLDAQTGETFSGVIRQIDNETIQMDITGNSGQISRTTRANLGFVATTSTIFDYGIATRGPLSLVGNASIKGINDSSEASVYIESFGTLHALDMVGNSSIEGNVSIVNTNGYATVDGNSEIGGETGQDAIDNHVATGAEASDFPVPDTSVFESYATNIVDDSTATSGNRTFQNIRIVENTNPTFSGNITIRGVVFIESPNHVEFSGNTTITGVVVTDGDIDFPNGSDSISFSGNLDCHGVSELPGDSAFDGLREQTGTFILAPGFSTSFSGNFSTIDGVIAANGLSFTGNAGGTITNSIINYSNTPMTLTGNSDISIDRSTSGDAVPSGFTAVQTLDYQAGSYSEVVL
jgi:Tfp pilus assembly protein PilX